MKIIDKFTMAHDEESPCQEFLFERYRIWRAEELKSSDWTQLPDAPVDAIAWATYRQKLRDLPKIKDFVNAELPERPL